jgi:hypothetical protein
MLERNVVIYVNHVQLLEPRSLKRCNHEATHWVIVESEFESRYGEEIIF